LPVVVRACETVEGHGRLYRSRRARGRAAAALRGAALGRIVARLGLPRGTPADVACRELASRTGRDAGEIRGILFGAAPADDAAPGGAPPEGAQPGRAEPRAALEAVRAGVAKAVVGQDPVVTGLVICLLCRGHALLEGVPGVAKTLLVRALAGTLSLRSARVQ